MDSTAIPVLRVLMRWMHIGSVVLLIGGAAFAWLIVRPVLDGLDPDDRSAMAGRLAVGFRPLVWAATAGIIGSGLFNFLSGAGVTTFYHVIFGIKMLLAAHVFASAFLLVRSGTDERKLFRRAGGIFASGIAIVLLSAILWRFK